jgi:hypothetical protein
VLAHTDVLSAPPTQSYNRPPNGALIRLLTHIRDPYTFAVVWPCLDRGKRCTFQLLHRLRRLF